MQHAISATLSRTGQEEPALLNHGGDYVEEHDLRGVNLPGVPRREPEDEEAGEGRRRVSEPGDVAAAVAFLASDQASYISGVNLMVDGEWMAC